LNHANINAVTSDTGETPLHLAIKHGNLQLIRDFCRAGADLTIGESSWNTVALHYVAKYCDEAEPARILLEHGAVLDPLESTDNWTPLHYAAKWNKNEVASVLIRAGANLHAKTKGGKTPRDIAEYHENDLWEHVELSNVRDFEALDESPKVCSRNCSIAKHPQLYSMALAGLLFLIGIPSSWTTDFVFR
jgi:ankyrin repeat protein